jgi:hypothetical protein
MAVKSGRGREFKSPSSSNGSPSRQRLSLSPKHSDDFLAAFAKLCRLNRSVGFQKGNEAHQKEELRKIKMEYVNAARSLAFKQREEADDLTEQWREIHSKAVEDAATRMVNARISAQLLEECDNADLATNVRESAEKADRNRFIVICTAYKSQFELMSQRHEHEFDRLHALLKDYVKLVKNQVKSPEK